MESSKNKYGPAKTRSTLYLQRPKDQAKHEITKDHWNICRNLHTHYIDIENLKKALSHDIINLTADTLRKLTNGNKMLAQTESITCRHPFSTQNIDNKRKVGLLDSLGSSQLYIGQDEERRCNQEQRHLVAPQVPCMLVRNALTKQIVVASVAAEKTRRCA